MNFFESYYQNIPVYFHGLFLIMLLYIILITIIPIITLGVRFVRKQSQKRQARIAETYKTAVFNYLMDLEHPIPAILEKRKGNVKKDIILDIIYELQRYMIGKEKQLLIDLAARLQLEDYVIDRLQHFYCYKKAYYLHRVASLSFPKISEKLLKQNLHSKNAERRLYALEALIRRHPEQIIPLLNTYRYPLTLWEQMNLYDFFTSMDKGLPDFHPLALSDNSTVAVFAIRMVRVFNQKRGSIVGYESLLQHPNPEVQGEMFRTLAEFGYTNLDSLFKDFIEKYPLQIQNNIITYLAKQTDAGAEELMRYFNANKSAEFKMHVLYCIYNFTAGGKEAIDGFISQKEDKMLHDLSNHLVTNVL